MDKGIIQYADNNNINEIDVNPGSNNIVETFHETDDAGNALLYFSFLLNHTLNSIVLKQPDLSQYMLQSPDHKPSTFFSSALELWNGDTAMIFEGKRIHLKFLNECLVSLSASEYKSFSLSDILTDDQKASSFFFYAFKIIQMD